MSNRREFDSVSLLARSARERLLLACVPIAFIWAAIAWALW
jgi:hypothetical protein